MKLAIFLSPQHTNTGPTGPMTDHRTSDARQGPQRMPTCEVASMARPGFEPGPVTLEAHTLPRDVTLEAYALPRQTMEIVTAWVTKQNQATLECRNSSSHTIGDRKETRPIRLSKVIQSPSLSFP